MKTFSDEYGEFIKTHEFKTVTAGGQDFEVMESGSGRAIVMLNGMDMFQTWIKYVCALEKNYRVVIMKYPVAIRKNVKMAAALNELFAKLDIEEPILAGVSDGGILAQLYAKMYKAGGLILISTLTVDSSYVESIKRERFVLPLMKFYARTVKFEKLREMLITAVKKHFRNESDEEKAYAVTFLELIGSDRGYRYSYLRALSATADISRLEKFRKSDFEYLSGKALVLIPENDMFDKADSKKLADIFTEPVVKQTYGGHLGLVMRPDLYIPEIERFLSEKF